MAERRTSFCEVRVGVADSFLMSYMAACQWKKSQELVEMQSGGDEETWMCRGGRMENKELLLASHCQTAQYFIPKAMGSANEAGHILGE